MNVLMHYRCEETIRKIVSEMNERISLNASPRRRPSVLIRYGYTGPVNLQATHTYNRADPVYANAANKARSRLIMQREELHVPHTLYGSRPAARLDLSGSWISRPTCHTRGVDFRTIRNNRAMARRHLIAGRYLSRIFPKTGELRIHVAHGKVLLIQDKNCGRALNSSRAGNTADWTVLLWDDYNIDMCRDAIAAVEALDLDFGAVDIVYNRRDFALLEVNSAPSLPGRIAPRKYARYFDWLIKEKPDEHIKVRRSSNVRSYIWREFT